MEEQNPYIAALYAVDPDLVYWHSFSSLDLALNPVRMTPQQRVRYDQYMKKLAKKYPGIAKQRWDLYKKSWVHDVNSSIKRGSWRLGNIEAGIQRFYELNTETGREMKETILNTLRNNLSGEDQDLKEKTIALLKQAPALAEMVVVDPKA